MVISSSWQTLTNLEDRSAAMRSLLGDLAVNEANSETLYQEDRNRTSTFSTEKWKPSND